MTKKKSIDELLPWSVFHEANQASGMVRRALKDDPEYRVWYKKHYPKSRHARK